MLVAASGPTYTPWLTGMLAIAVGLALLIGLLTPIASALAACGYLVMGVSSLLAVDLTRHASAFIALDLTAISIAAILLGPGAFSLDARLFGRRRIIIPEGPRHPTR